MSAKHTPGPWLYQENADAYTHIVRASSKPNLILVHMRQDPSGVTEANARLIAAAPDLLAIAWKVEEILSKQKWIPNAKGHSPEAQLLAQVRAALMSATAMDKDEWVSRCAQRLVSFGGVKYLDDATEEANTLYAIHTKDGGSPPWPTEAADADIATWKD